MSQQPNHRRVKNYLINPAFQLKYVIYFLVSGFAVVATTFALVHHKLNGIRLALVSPHDNSYNVHAHISEVLTEVSLLTLATFFVFALISFAYAVIISHRIAGPIIPITRYIDEIKKGNYDAYGALRKYDELNPIMEKLNELAEHLKATAKEK